MLGLLPVAGIRRGVNNKSPTASGDREASGRNGMTAGSWLSREYNYYILKAFSFVKLFFRLSQNPRCPSLNRCSLLLLPVHLLFQIVLVVLLFG